jgi:hypothetical protein
MSHDEAFNLVVQLIRRGESSLDIENRLEHNTTGIESIPKFIGEARKYVEELQTEAFAASVDAFINGDTVQGVEEKLRKLGFHPWDAQVVAERAKKRADVERAQEKI